VCWVCPEELISIRNEESEGTVDTEERFRWRWEGAARGLGGKTLDIHAGAPPLTDRCLPDFFLSGGRPGSSHPRSQGTPPPMKGGPPGGPKNQESIKKPERSTLGEGHRLRGEGSSDGPVNLSTQPW